MPRIRSPHQHLKPRLKMLDPDRTGEFLPSRTEPRQAEEQILVTAHIIET